MAFILGEGEEEGDDGESEGTNVPGARGAGGTHEGEAK